MCGTTLKRLAFTAVAAVALLSLSAKPAQAGWHWWGWGWHYSHTPYYVTVYRPIVYQSWCYTPVCCYPRVSCFRPRIFSCWRVYSYCYDPCWTCGYDPCCCAAPVVETPGAGATAPRGEPTPAAPEPAAPEAAAPEPAETQPQPPAPSPPAVTPPAPSPPAATQGTDQAAPAGTSQQTGSVTLAVHVPADARVYVNGYLTKTPGTVRQYISRGLVPGYQYTYKLRAVVHRDGKELSDTRVVRMRAGENHEVTFDFGAANLAAR